MTAREMIKALQDLGEKNLDRELAIRKEGTSDYWTPYTVKVLTSTIYGKYRGDILIY